MTRPDTYDSDNATEQFFRDAAAKEGLSFHNWCDKYGIVDNAMTRQIRRHEVPPFAVADGLRTPSEQGNAKAGAFHRGGTHQGDGDREDFSDPKFAIRGVKSAPE